MDSWVVHGAAVGKHASGFFSFSRLGVLLGAQGWLKCEHSLVAATVENPPCGHSLIKLRCTPMAQHGQLGCAWHGSRQTIFQVSGICVFVSGRPDGCPGLVEMNGRVRRSPQRSKIDRAVIR